MFTFKKERSKYTLNIRILTFQPLIKCHITDDKNFERFTKIIKNESWTTLLV